MKIPSQYLEGARGPGLYNLVPPPYRAISQPDGPEL